MLFFGFKYLPNLGILGKSRYHSFNNLIHAAAAIVIDPCFHRPSRSKTREWGLAMLPHVICRSSDKTEVSAVNWLFPVCVGQFFRLYVLKQIIGPEKFKFMVNFYENRERTLYIKTIHCIYSKNGCCNNFI